MSSPPSEDEQASSPAADEVPERPALAPDVELAGPMQGTRFTEQLWLIRRGGRLLQVPEPFYRVAEQINGERTPDEIAAAVMESTDWLVSADLVRQIIEKKLVPFRLVRALHDPVLSHSEERDHTPLQIDLHRQEFGPRAREATARILRNVPTISVIIPLLIAAGVACAWLQLARGVADGTRTILHSARRFAPRVRAGHRFRDFP